MQVKKFEAATMQEALEKVKQELGPEAIILQTRKAKKGLGLLAKGGVEITAAVSERSVQKKKITEAYLADGSKEAVRKLSAEKQANLIEKYTEKHVEKAQPKKITATRYIDIDKQELPVPTQKQPEVPKVPAIPSRASLEEEIKTLKKMIEELKEEARATSAMDASRDDLLDRVPIQEKFEQLVLNGVSRKNALTLVKKVSFNGPQTEDRILDSLAHEIVDSVKTKKILSQNSPKWTVLVGPTGVGKTTTIAKLVSIAMHQKKLKVGMINLDQSKSGGFEQLAAYAKILKVPFRNVTSTEDLKAAVMDFHGLDKVFIDTAGCSQRDPEALKWLVSLLSVLPEVETYLVLSATTRDAELYDASNRFAPLKPQGLFISKLDEATLFGGLYNLSQKINLPFVCFTTGQKIPDDIEDATSERVAALVMEI